MLVFLVDQEPLAQRDLRDHLDSLVQLEESEHLVVLVLRVQMVLLGHLELQVCQDQLVLRVVLVA